MKFLIRFSSSFHANVFLKLDKEHWNFSDANTDISMTFQQSYSTPLFYTGSSLIAAIKCQRNVLCIETDTVQFLCSKVHCISELEAEREEIQ